jgi:hypothetical protein
MSFSYLYFGTAAEKVRHAPQNPAFFLACDFTFKLIAAQPPAFQNLYEFFMT